MKGISMLTGAVLALGLGGAPAAFADDDLDEVTMEMVFDEVDEIGAMPLSLERDEEVAREERDGAESDGARDGREAGDRFVENERVADRMEDDHEFERDEAGEGDREDHDVEEPEHEMDGERDGELRGEDRGEGEDVADGSDLLDDVGDDDIAAESDAEATDEVLEDDVAEGDGDLA